MKEEAAKANDTQPSSSEELTRSDVEAVDRLKKAYQTLNGEVAKVIVGQTAVIEELMVALFCRGHCLLEQLHQRRQINWCKLENLQ